MNDVAESVLRAYRSLASGRARLCVRLPPPMSRAAIVLSVLLAVPSIAFAQTTTAAAPTRDKQGVTFDEVERGAFFGVQGGISALMNPPAEAGRPRPFSWGQTALVEVGYEVFDRISVALFIMGVTNRAPSTYTGYSNNQVTSGDFSTFVPGATARISVWGLPDGQDVHRTFFYVRGGAGFASFWPKALLPNGDLFMFFGPGVEYFTRLRHFSVGIEVDGTLMLSTGTTGFSVTPNLRYAF